jgi:hypothetical protein
MTSLQTKKLKMYLVLRVLLRANPEILALMPNSQEFLTALDVAIIDIQQYSALQQEDNSELSNQKKQLKAKLVGMLLDNGGKIQAYANYKKDTQLLAATKATETELNRMDEIKLVEYAKGLYNKTNEHMMDLIPYRITAEMQNELMGNITNFETISPQAKKEKLDSHNVTVNLVEAYATADSIVANFDMEVEIIRRSHPQFYSDYKAITKVNKPTDVVQLIGQIIDSETGAGLPNATITLIINNTAKDPIVKQSADKGGFWIKTIAPGIYTATVTKIGYQTQTIAITVMGDEPYGLEVKLVKTPNP